MSRIVTLAGYVAVVLAALALEVSARRTGRVATASASLRSALGHRAVQVVLLAGWLWLGWHLFARVDWQS